MIANRTIFFIKKLFFKLVFLLSPVYLFIAGIGLLYSDNLIFLPPAANYQLTDELISITSKNADSDSPHTIVASLRIHPDAKYTVIYSHGNAIDISGLYRLQQQFYKHGYSIIIYDYSGYGLSQGRASEQQSYNDVQAIYNYLITQRKLKPEQILSYGHSLGAAIATDLAANNPIAGLILESAFTSAFRVKTVYPLLPFDKFSSISKIQQIKTPVFIVHSRDDPVIPFWHGQALYEKAEQPKKALWFDDTGHSGITHHHAFWPALSAFFTHHTQ